MTESETRTLSWRAVLLFVAVLLAVALAVNWYNTREQDRNVDRQVEQIGG